MRYNECFKSLSQRAEKVLSDSPHCHDWEHTLRVLHNARTIIKKEKIPAHSRRIIEIAVLLHDIARPHEMAAKGHKCHAKLGALLAKGLLEEAGMQKDFSKKVIKCIERHRYRGDEKPVTVEEKIVYDADKLDSLGAVGIGRAFLFAGKMGAKLHNTEKEATNSPAYGENDTAYREYLVKLRHIPEKMLTAAGRKIARERLKFMDIFFMEINNEIYR